MSLKGTYEATSTSSLWHTSKNDVRENSTHSFPRRKQAYAVKKKIGVYNPVTHSGRQAGGGKESLKYQ